ncbi:dynein light chain 4, axonemal isoform X1 [Ornithorhynchus anatinus]|uniref:dynein light chain 4, axonemal isoform X1 n=1 Tax=Ornithorhynchus anatinus TaxID=9258 RepID=UPI0010A773A9|nr:dynein light chain 4, axonemal isoform X1 [Ornithorhynchus anatinus]XP_028935352.1 dynein light chain 4, axonemal isoform X1 [Ornithorhynchus anatinus]
MGEPAEGKKEEADYKRVHTFPLVRHTDMPEEMRVEAMELCVTACEKFATNNESAAKMIKETMDKKFGSSWHVVIGEGFGFEITHEVSQFGITPGAGPLLVPAPAHHPTPGTWLGLSLSPQCRQGPPLD